MQFHVVPVSLMVQSCNKKSIVTIENYSSLVFIAFIIAVDLIFSLLCIFHDLVYLPFGNRSEKMTRHRTSHLVLSSKYTFVAINYRVRGTCGYKRLVSSGSASIIIFII